jgi:GNAT superfamily N-acetyltransferase
MAGVGMRELRKNLKYYMDQLKAGEEFVIIKNSAVIGRLVPTKEAAAKRGKIGRIYPISDGRAVLFRQYRPEDREAVKQLHELAMREAGTFDDVNSPWLDLDLEDISQHYLQMGGDFLVGVIGSQVVAMGAFRPAATGRNEAELKRMRVRQDLQGQGIGTAIIKLLESRARKQGYLALVLDTVAGTPAQHFYERHGYHETKREPNEKFVMVFYKKEL